MNQQPAPAQNPVPFGDAKVLYTLPWSSDVVSAVAFIGSDTQLIAPVEVGANAYVGTGTTVRENVPAGALAVSAGRQRTIEDWVAKKGRTKP